MIVKITKIKPLRPDERGLAYGFSLRESRSFIVINRKKGTVSGGHYHKGKSMSKSPEIFYIANGKIKLIAKDIETGKSEEHVIDENNLLEVPANVYHEVHALTDTIFIEFNVEPDKYEFREDTVLGEQKRG